MKPNSRSDQRRAEKWQARDDAQWGRKAARNKAARDAADLERHITRWNTTERPLLLVKARLAGVGQPMLEHYKSLPSRTAYDQRFELQRSIFLAERKQLDTTTNPVW